MIPSTVMPFSAITQLSTVQSSPVVVPASNLYADDNCAHLNVTSSTEPSAIFPRKEVEIKHTYASYHEQPIPDVVRKNHDSWTLCLSVPIPSDLANPMLTSLIYIIKYSTTHDNGNSTVQADTVLTTIPCPDGITASSVDKKVYRSGSEYGPKMVNKDSSLCLSAVSAVKCNGGNAQWSHYIDHRHLLPNVRIVEQSYLYLNFHVAEYPTAQTLRCLGVEVSACWVEDAEARKAKEEAERLAREEEERMKEKERMRVKAEAERLVEAERLERERKAQVEKLAREEEERKKEDERMRVKAEADRLVREANEEAQRLIAEAKEEVKRLVAAASKPQISTAPHVADSGVQQLMREAFSKPEFAHRVCEKGYEWRRTDRGYQCSGGGHKLTFAELGMI